MHTYACICMQTHGVSSIFSYRIFLCIESGCVYLDVHGGCCNVGLYSNNETEMYAKSQMVVQRHRQEDKHTRVKYMHGQSYN